MGQQDRTGWAFVATPRELQFLVVGILVGIVVVLFWRAAGIPDTRLSFVVAGLLGAFGLLCIGRGSG